MVNGERLTPKYIVGSRGGKCRGVGVGDLENRILCQRQAGFSIEKRKIKNEKKKKDIFRVYQDFVYGRMSKKDFKLFSFYCVSLKN